ncbi:MAG: hypothetical protein C4557_07865 [Anaerolineaceae bacterium]|jgi:hypothetical protein|nr:MAG: hypothetical protein C4557_07865 [Anaerolineaceae bacterium]
MTARLVVKEGNVTIRDLTGSGDVGRIESMLGLYENLFPQYQHYVPRMRRRAQFESEHRPGHVVHYWLVEVDGQPAGLRTFRYVRDRHCGLAHALAISPSFRHVQAAGKRLAVFVIYECLAQIIRDAVERDDPPPLGMVNEVEPERLMDYYTHNGLIQLPLKYVEPIFPPEVEGRSRQEELTATRFSPMRMGFLPNPQVKIKKYTREMIADFAMAFLADHYGLPQNHPIILEVVQSINTEE